MAELRFLGLILAPHSGGPEVHPIRQVEGDQVAILDRIGLGFGGVPAFAVRWNVLECPGDLLVVMNQFVKENGAGKRVVDEIERFVDVDAFAGQVDRLDPASTFACPLLNFGQRDSVNFGQIHDRRITGKCVNRCEQLYRKCGNG